MVPAEGSHSRSSHHHSHSSSRRDDSHSSSRDSSRDSDRTIRAPGNSTRSSSSNSKAVVHFANDSLDLHRTRSGSGSSRALATRSGGDSSVSRSSHSTRDASSTRGPGFETRLEKLEAKSSGGKSSSSRGAGFETRLAKLEKGSEKVGTRSKSSSSGPGNATLLRKVDNMQEQMANMKLDAHMKELQDKDDKLWDAERKLRRAEDRLDFERAAARPVRPVYHLLQCTCDLCRSYRQYY